MMSFSIERMVDKTALDVAKLQTRHFEYHKSLRSNARLLHQFGTNIQEYRSHLKIVILCLLSTSLNDMVNVIATKI